MQFINTAKWIVNGGSSSDLYPGPLPRIPSKKVVCTTSVWEVHQGGSKLHLSRHQEKALNLYQVIKDSEENTWSRSGISPDCSTQYLI